MFQPSDPMSFKRRLEKENEDLMDKMKRMKRDYDKIEEETRQLRMKFNLLENKYDSLCKQNAEMEDEKMDLKEKLETEKRDESLLVGLLMERRFLHFEYTFATTIFNLL